MFGILLVLASLSPADQTTLKLVTPMQAPAGTGCSTGEGCGDPILDSPCAAQQHGCGCRESTGECTQKKKSIEVPADLSGKGPTFGGAPKFL